MEKDLQSVLQRIGVSLQSESSLRKRQEEQERQDWRNRLKLSGVPHPIQRLLLDGARRTDALRKAWKAYKGGTRLIVLAGPTGSGKSVAAAHLGVSAGFVVRWAHSTDIAFMAPWKEDYKVALGVRVLVLDDVGIEVENDMAKDKVEGLITKRFDGDDLLTIVTTNLRGATRGKSGRPCFRERYGDRVWRRILDGGAFLECREKESPGQLELGGTDG